MSIVPESTTDFNFKDVHGKTALHNAAEKNDLPEIVKLISLGANIDAKDIFNRTPLHVAAICNQGDSHFTTIELLLQKGARVNAQDANKNTPLHFSTGQASVRIIQLLLDYKACTDTINAKGECPVLTAIREKNLEVVQFLMNRDDFSMGYKHKYGDGWTPLHYASRFSDDARIIEFFIKNGADTDNVNKKNSLGDTPLFEAIRGGNFRIVQRLLDYGANLNSTNADASTPLHIACRHCDDVKIVRIFIECGVNVVNKFSNPPLFEAVKRGNVEIVELLLESGANVNFVNSQNGMTPLYCACLKFKNPRIIRVLLKSGADVDLMDSIYFFRLAQLSRSRSPGSRARPAVKLLEEKFGIDRVETLRLALKYNGVNKIAQKIYKILSVPSSESSDWKTVLEHIAKIQILELPLNSDLIQKISSLQKLEDYFKACKEELLKAKNCKIDNSWITYFDLLVDNSRKLKNYAGNEVLVQDFRKSDLIYKFPIYGAQMDKNMEKGIKRRDLFDESSILLSNCLPVFNPNHLIIKDILDCLIGSRDLKQICK